MLLSYVIVPPGMCQQDLLRVRSYLQDSYTHSFMRLRFMRERSLITYVGTRASQLIIPQLTD